MKNNNFKECPICYEQLEKHNTLNHPVKGIIHNIPHHACSKCGEIFLNGESFDIVHFHGHKQRAVA